MYSNSIEIPQSTPDLNLACCPVCGLCKRTPDHESGTLSGLRSKTTALIDQKSIIALSALNHVFQINPHGVPEVFPNLVLGHPEMFGCFTLDDSWLPTDELHAVDEHLDKQAISRREIKRGLFNR